MTTAFASLWSVAFSSLFYFSNNPDSTNDSNGTPILQWDNVLSYLCYFFFVFFIWVSQVAYSIRFRQADWFHRIMVRFQSCLVAIISVSEPCLYVGVRATEHIRWFICVHLQFQYHRGAV